MEIAQTFETKDYQGAVPRGVALLIDQLLLTLPLLVLIPLLKIQPYQAPLWPLGFVMVLLVYKIGMESWYGQTLGKKVLRIRVAMLGGEQCTLKAAIIRNVGLLLDSVPFLFISGLVTMYVFSFKNQRIGDQLAKTVVVKS